MAGEASEGSRLLLIDAHGLAFRAYHALPEMTNRRGESIRVAYGYTSQVLLALEQGFDCAVSAFDPPGPIFRDREYAEYKATRQPTPDEVVEQVPVCQRITEQLNITVAVVPEYEADDVMGTLATQASGSGCSTVILSGDVDLLQLVDENTVVQFTGRGGDPVRYDVAAVWERFGFGPDRIVDFKALRGDSSDNIPGVPGVGDKTATSLIQEYGDLESILAALERMPPGRVRSNLEAHAEQARLGRRLVTIVREVPGVTLDLASCRLRDYDRESAANLLEELGMPSLVRRLPAAAPQSGTQVERPHAAPAAVVTTTAGLAEMVAALRRGGVVTVQVATDGPARKGRLAGLALADTSGSSWHLPLRSLDGPWLTWAQLRPLLDLLADPDVPKSGYQAKEALLALRADGAGLEGIDFDCVLAAYLADSRSRTASLAALCREWGGPPAPEPEVYLGKGAASRLPSQLTQAEAAQLYGSEAACAAAIRPALEGRLERFQGRELLRDLELPVLQILADMEKVGVRLDGAQLGDISAEMQGQIAGLEAGMFQIAGQAFSPGSPPQLAALLYDQLGLKSSRRTKTGRSTDAQALEALREEHPMVGMVLEWRQLTKLKSTYVDALPLLIDPEDGRVHTSFNQAVAATGRLSSSDPNLQNIPIRTELGRRIRAAFVPEPGWVLLSADYSQIELRVLAHLSGDPQLRDSFARGDDVHADTAAQVFGVGRDQVSADQRRMAKVVNFGILYGLSSFGLSRDLGIPGEVAEDFIRRYFANYSGVRGYLDSVRTEARRDGYVSTMLGRRRYLPEINSTNRQVREATERMAINMPVQGSAADIMKLGMIRTAQALGASGFRARMLLQVHDELLFEAPGEEVDQVGELAVQGMAGALELEVPMVVDLKTGPNWRDLRPLGRVAG
ncbi:MAG: DNA polymerase I [Candidatus Dormibacteria bacterium]